MSSTPKPTLEPKFGWGHEAALKELKEDIAKRIEAIYIDSSWSAQEVVKRLLKEVRS